MRASGGGYNSRSTGTPCRLSAMLLARIYETLQLVCLLCQSPMRIIAFIAEGSTVREILEYLGESTLLPNIAPAHWPPLWELELAQAPPQANEFPQWDQYRNTNRLSLISWRIGEEGRECDEISVVFGGGWADGLRGTELRGFWGIRRQILAVGVGDLRSGAGGNRVEEVFRGKIF